MADTSRIPVSSLQFPDGFQEIDTIITGYKRQMILTSALKMGVFDYLEKSKAASREEIVSSLPLCGMLSRSYLNALVSMNILSVDGEKYSNTQISRDFLIKESPYYQGDVILGSSKPGSRWDLLSDAMQSTDGIVPSSGPGPSMDHLHMLAQRVIQGEAQELTRWIGDLPGFTECKKMLDIGGGHGLYTIGICQLNPDMDAVILDQPHVIELTDSYIQKYGLEKRIIARQGDIRTEVYKPEYDIILISHLLYKFRNDLDEIFRLVSNGLKDGGILVSNHYFCSPGCVPMQNAVVELERSLQSAGHPLCHPEHFEGLFQKYGLSCICTRTLDTSFGVSYVHAAKKVVT